MTRMVIEGGLLVDPGSEQALPGTIIIENGRIAAIESADTRVDDAQRVSAHDCLVIPGLVNAHTHSHGALGRGLVADRAALEMFLATGTAISGSRATQDKYLSAVLSAVELIRKGCTACYDLFVEFPGPTLDGVNAVAQAYADIGLRAVVAPMMADRTLYQALPGLLDSLPAEIRKGAEAARAPDYVSSMETCAELHRGWNHDRHGVAFGLGPTIPLHCSDAFLTACSDFSRDHSVPLQTHLAESRAQAALALRRHDCSLTEHLRRLGFLSERLSAAHAIWLGDDDMDVLAGHGVAIAHNPSSNLRLGSGVARLRAMLSKGLCVGVGTDSSNTSDGQNMFEAARLAAYLTRIDGDDPAGWVSAAEALSLATEGSARVLGHDRIGRLAPGFEADLVFLSLAAPHFVPLRSPVMQMMFAETGSSVEKVMIGGRIVYEDGRMLTVDEAALRRQAEEAAQRLDEENGPALISARDTARYVGLFCCGLACPESVPNRKFQ